MKFKVFAIYDNAAKFYNNPFYMQEKAMAERAFRNLVEDQATEISKTPSDYSLFYIGEYDNEQGTHISTNPERICSGQQYAIQAANSGANDGK